MESYIPHLLCKMTYEIDHVVSYVVQCDLKDKMNFLAIIVILRIALRKHNTYTGNTGRKRYWLFILSTVDFFSV